MTLPDKRLLQKCWMTRQAKRRTLLVGRNQIAKLIKTHGNQALKSKNQMAVSNSRIFMCK